MSSNLLPSLRIIIIVTAAVVAAKYQSTGEKQPMTWVKWIVAAIGIVIGGWMAFDGGRALVKGDYVTPSAGPYAGQLGPWAKVVRGAGIEPRATGMKIVFVIFGVLWLVAAGAHAAEASWAGTLLIALSVLSLWYLPVGTLLAVVELVLLLFVRSRAPLS